MWSSFDYGIVHYVLLNTETDFPGANEGSNSSFKGGPFGGPGTGNPALLEWLEADLQKVNRTLTPWLIVYGHRPLYTSDADDVQIASCVIMRSNFEQLFLQYKVDVYVSGHIHYYERLFPIANMVPQIFYGNVYDNPTAPIYLINGAAGNDEGHQPYLLNMSITAAIDATDYGYSRMHIFNETHFLWEFYLATTQKVADFVWIVKEPQGTGGANNLNATDPYDPSASDSDLINNSASSTGYNFASGSDSDSDSSSSEHHLSAVTSDITGHFGGSNTSDAAQMNMFANCVTYLTVCFALILL